MEPLIGQRACFAHPHIPSPWTWEFSLKCMPVAMKGTSAFPLMTFSSPPVSCFTYHLCNSRETGQSTRHGRTLSYAVCPPPCLYSVISLHVAWQILFKPLVSICSSPIWHMCPLGDPIIRFGDSLGIYTWISIHTGCGGGGGAQRRTVTVWEETRLDGEAESSYPGWRSAGGPSLRGGFDLLLLFGNELRFLKRQVHLFLRIVVVELSDIRDQRSAKNTRGVHRKCYLQRP